MSYRAADERSNVTAPPLPGTDYLAVCPGKGACIVTADTWREARDRAAVELQAEPGAISVEVSW